MAPTRDDIDAAADRIGPIVRTTPVLTVPAADLGVPAELEATISLKLELVQHSGSFKARGATNFLRATETRPDGVVAASGGNHGAAVAWAASELAMAANIFVPTISAEAKVNRLRSYGATVHQVGAVYAEALAASEAFLADHDANAVHAYESDLVIAGAGTTGREFDEQAPGLDAVLVACGGGGLVSGVAAWFGERAHVVACETRGTAAYARAVEADAPTPVDVSGIAADALGAPSIGTIAWGILRQAGASSVVVDDDDVVAARALLWDRFRIVAEPSAAVPVAAIASGAYSLAPRSHVGVIICGANTSGELPS